MQPLVSDHSGEPGRLRYRQIEYYRMPVMAYLSSLSDPTLLTRSDYVRLGLVTGVGESDATLPYAEQHLEDFEKKYCYDRFWVNGGSAPNTRYMCSGYSLVVVGDARSRFFCCRDRGVLAQFRHQHFLLFLISHFQKASLLLFSDQLVEALSKLDVRNTPSVKRFKRAPSGTTSRASCASRTATGSTRSRSRRRCRPCRISAPRTWGSIRSTTRSRSASPT